MTLRARGLDVEVLQLALRLGLAQVVDQDVGVVGRVADGVLVLVRPVEMDLDRVVLGPQHRGLDLAAIELREERVERSSGRLVVRRDQLRREERQHDHDQDRERGALEERS
jgi:hypothetical protein